jgi:hypothetical protein
MHNNLQINAELQKHLQRTDSVHDGIQYVFKFENNYGASVIRHQYSYGGSKGLWEIAVLKDDELDYTSPITNDIVGWLDQDGVTDTLFQISKL